MDGRIFKALLFLGRHVFKGTEKLDDFYDILCEHKFTTVYDSQGQPWKKCDHCGRLE